MSERPLQNELGTPATIRIVRAANCRSCPFWVSLFHPGKFPLSGLTEFSDLQEMLHEAAVSGVREEKAVMMVDASRNETSCTYLLPTAHFSQRERHVSVDDLVQVLRQWNPDKVGFYLAPELLNPDTAREVVQLAIKKLVVSSGVRHFYFLIGSHGFNTVANVAAQVRRDLTQMQVSARIIH